MADGLLQQEFGNFDRALPEAFQYAQGYNNVLQKALDTLELRKQQEMRSKYNETMLDKAQQMSPLEIMRARAEAAKAEAMSTPEMLQSAQQGYMGQNLLQHLAGKRAEATQDARIGAENAEYGSTTATHGREKELDDLLRMQYNQDLPEQDRITAATKRQHVIQELMQTPKFAQQLKLQDDRLENALLLRDMQNEQKMRELQEKHSKEVEAKTLQHMYNRDVTAYRANPTPENKEKVQASWEALQAQLLAAQQGKANIGAFGIEQNTPVPKQAPGTGSGNRKPLGDY